jgi:probable F420-dependent oxidoreductase
MKFGFQLPTGMEGLIVPTPFFHPADFLTMAKTGEQLGYDSIWGNDHYAAQNYVREKYGTNPNFFEVLTVLAAVASVTRHISLGTSVLVLPMRDIVLVARQVATLDQLSGGRLLIGVGIGAYKEEYESAYPALSNKNRGDILEEGLDLLNRLFTEDGVTYRGKYYHVENLSLRPRPAQFPFPLLVGGHQKFGIDRAVRFGQGWIPGWRPFEELRDWITLLREKAAEAGRDPQAMIVAPQFSCLVARTREEAIRRYQQSGMVGHRVSLAYTGRDPALSLENNLIGSPVSILEQLERLHEFGVNHLSALSFCVNTVDEYAEQMHYFAEEVMAPYRRAHGIPIG